MLRPRQAAPDFTVLTDDGSLFRLADHRGRPVVLYFYPKDFTLGCIREACAFRDNYRQVQALGAVLLGVSADSAESHQRFKEKYALPFPLATDTALEVARLYDVERRFLPRIALPPAGQPGEGLPGKAARTGRSPFSSLQRVTYVIGPDGRIAGAFHHELAIGRHQDDTLAALEQVRATDPASAADASRPADGHTR
jgi:peroxiredoxin Q/BCP